MRCVLFHMVMMILNSTVRQKPGARQVLPFRAFPSKNIVNISLKANHLTDCLYDIEEIYGSD